MVLNQLKSLESRRRALRISRAAIAKRTGLSLPTLNRILAGEGNPTLETLAALASVLGVEFQITNHGLVIKELCSAHEFRKLMAEQKALRLVRMVQGTAALEAQAVDKVQEQEMVERTIHELLVGPARRLWTS